MDGEFLLPHDMTASTSASATTTSTGTTTTTTTATTALDRRDSLYSACALNTFQVGEESERGTFGQAKDQGEVKNQNQREVKNRDDGGQDDQDQDQDQDQDHDEDQDDDSACTTPTPKSSLAWQPLSQQLAAIQRERSLDRQQSGRSQQATLLTLSQYLLEQNSLWLALRQRHQRNLEQLTHDKARALEQERERERRDRQAEADWHRMLRDAIVDHLQSKGVAVDVDVDGDDDKTQQQQRQQHNLHALLDIVLSRGDEVMVENDRLTDQAQQRVQATLRSEHKANQLQQDHHQLQTENHQLQTESRELYDLLRANQDALQAKDDSLQAKEDALQTKEATLQTKDDTIRQLQTEHQDAARIADDTIRQLHVERQELRDMLQARDDALQAKDDELRAKDDELRAKDDALQAKENALQVKDDALRGAHAANGELEGSVRVHVKSLRQLQMVDSVLRADLARTALELERWQDHTWTTLQSSLRTMCHSSGGGSSGGGGGSSGSEPWRDRLRELASSLETRLGTIDRMILDMDTVLGYPMMVAAMGTGAKSLPLPLAAPPPTPSPLITTTATATTQSPSLSLEPWRDQVYRDLDRILDSGQHLSPNAHLFQPPAVLDRMRHDLECDLNAVGLQLQCRRV